MRTWKYEYYLKNNFNQLCPHFRLLSCSLAWQPPYAITKECERTLKLQNQLMSRSRFPALKIYWRCHTVQWVIFDKIFSRARCQKVSEIFAKLMLICQENENFTTSNKYYFLKVCIPFYAILFKNHANIEKFMNWILKHN